MADDDLQMEPNEPELPVQPVTVQHPALGGDVQGEIDHRTADPAAEPNQFSRIFHLGGLGCGRADHPVHLANAAETLGDAIRRGLHPKGDVHLVDAAETNEPREKYTSLTYAVDVVPAVIDHDAASTITPHDVAQAAWIGEHGPELAFSGFGDAVPGAQAQQAPVQVGEPIPVPTDGSWSAVGTASNPAVEGQPGGEQIVAEPSTGAFNSAPEEG